MKELMTAEEARERAISKFPGKEHKEIWRMKMFAINQTANNGQLEVSFSDPLPSIFKLVLEDKCYRVTQDPDTLINTISW